MPAGLVIVWENGAPASRIVREERELPGKAVIRDGDSVAVYMTRLENFESGMETWPTESVMKIVAVVAAEAPGLRIDASLIEFALKVNTGNSYAAEAAAREKVEAALAVGATEVRVDVDSAVIKFADVFQLDMDAPPPFPIPAEYQVLSTSLHKGKRAELMIGSAIGSMTIVQADIGDALQQPPGWFMAGFWGHGVNSYSVYYGRATERSRVFLRLPYGAGVYETDKEGARALALATMKKYVALAETLPCKHVTLVESQGYAHWRIERLDGTVAEMEHQRDEYFSSLDTYDFEAIAGAGSQPCGLEIVWSGDRPVHRLLRAPCVIGREEHAPHDERMSRKHAAIRQGSPNPYVEDLGSNNGTIVGGESLINSGRSVPDGTIVRLGRTVGVLVTDVDDPQRLPHPAVARARTIHEVANVPVHHSYVTWALAQTWASAEHLAATTLWAIGEKLAEGEKLLRIGHRHPPGRGAHVTPFARRFEHSFGEPPPFSIPEHYWVYDEHTDYEHPGSTVEDLIGVAAKRAMTVETDEGGVKARPIGWMVAGFASHDVPGQNLRTAAFCYGRVTKRSRLYLRLRLSSEAGERNAQRTKALATLKKYVALIDSLPCKHITLQQAFEAADWRIERLDGSIAEMTHTPDMRPTHLDELDFDAIARGA